LEKSAGFLNLWEESKKDAGCDVHILSKRCLIAPHYWTTLLSAATHMPTPPAMRLLVIEDDSKIASFIVNGLKQNGFGVDAAADGEQGLDLACTVTYDCIVLDLMLPKLDGLSLLRQLRKEKVNTPVVILSAKATVDDRVKGLQAGGDDYLTKPFAFSELLARVQALIRRATHVVEPTTLTAAGVTLDLLSREVRREGRSIELQSREFALLELLMRTPGRVVTKTMILEHVWDYSFDPQTNVVDVLVHRLRAKLDKDFEVKLIQTIRGVGYVLKPV
jgi:two-component system, OmpR family, response regulator